MLDLDSLQVEVEIEYVLEKAELDDPLLDDFKTIFEKFTFKGMHNECLKLCLKVCLRR